MALMGQAVEHRRLRAPRADGGILIEPPLALATDLVARNASIVAGADCDLAGRPLKDVARQAREELLREAVDYTRQYRNVEKVSADPSAPVVLAGHQPQLFHPGVWFKNFVLSGLAEAQGATAVNLVIDSDTIKTAAVRVPGGNSRRPQVESVSFDRASAEIPFEERTILDRNCLASFGDRAGAVVKRLIPDPLLDEFWPLVAGRSAANQNLGECLSQARHIQEERWGGQSLELPQSRICSLPAFYLFTAHLLGNLPRLREVYNAAVAEYRRENRIRSLAHPVPDLALEQGWLEAPFWIWCGHNPRRRRLFVCRQGDELVLSDRASIRVRIKLKDAGNSWTAGDGSAAAAQLAELRASGVKIRTRALITTMFARLLLGDLFLHGLGGAKYDQVTDQLISRFFGLEPPAYLTVTATLRLPIAHEQVTPDDRRLIDARLRELRYHPERYAEGADGATRALVEEKQRWIATEPTHDNARTRCREIRRANDGLQPWVEKLRGQLLAERDQLAAGLRAEAILSSRDHAFCLYPAEALRKLMGSAQ
jgi:hypothetical protein